MSYEEIASLRRRIDEVDAQIASLLAERIGIARKIGEHKRRLKLPIEDVRREKEVISRVRRLAQDMGVPPEDYEAIFREIISACKRAQSREKKVAFLGPWGTFTEEAARRFFPKAGTEFIPAPSIYDVFRMVTSQDADYGVVPVENSVEGSVNATLDLLFSHDVQVCGEVELPIRHCLIVAPGTSLEDIDVIISHPQALAQCRRFLEERLPGRALREVDSTAKAVEMLKEIRNAAAIGTEVAAERHGMVVIARDIQNSPRNFTRFLAISTHDQPPTGRDKTSLVFSIPHVPGSLYKALEVFAKRNINLTKIESRPTRHTPWEYIFFLDFEGHRLLSPYHEAIEELSRRAIFVKVLGSYPRAT